MLNKLQPGMSERQVIFVMGNPVLRNPYQSSRWDYLYTLEEGDKITQQYRISVHFDANGRFTHYTGNLPAQEIKEQNQLDSLPREQASPNTVPEDL